MSDVSQGPGWWQAADGKWYPPAAPQPPQPPSYQPPLAPPGYGAPQPGYYPQNAGPKNDGMSIAALVCGIVGIVLVFCWVGVILGILGLIFGIIGMKKVERSNGMLKGRGMALAGAICGGVAIVLFIGMVILLIISAASSTTSGY